MKERNIKIISLITVLVVLVSTFAITFTGCALFKLGNSAFDEFVDELIKEVFDGDAESINVFLNYPERLGLSDCEAKLPDPYKNQEEFEQDMDGLKDFCSYLTRFNYKSLTKENKRIYDVLFTYFYNLSRYKDYYYLRTTYLGSQDGNNAELPMTLVYYVFKSENDIVNYISLMEQSKTQFPKYVAWENERIAAGYGRADFIYQGIVDQCISFAGEDNSKDDEHFLIHDFTTKINAVTFLNDSEKTNYINEFMITLKEDMLPAYRKVAKDVKLFIGNIHNNNSGLSHYKNGKDYYELLVKNMVGTNESINDIYNNLVDAYNATLDEYESLQTSLGYTDSQVDHLFDELEENSVFHIEGEATDEHAQQVLEKLQAMYYDIKEKAKDDFPSLNENTPEPTFMLVDKSLKDYYAPASYLKSAIDDNKARELITINGYTDTGYLGYELISHEGYPGHMLDHSLSKNNLPVIRSLFGPLGYSEGWATYVEFYTAKYYGNSQEERDVYNLYMLSNLRVGYLICIMDILVNYKDYGAAQLARDYLNGNSDAAQNIMEFLVENPSNYLVYYYSYYKFTELRKSFNGTDLQFHTAVLAAGDTPFTLLGDYIKN